MAIATTKRFRCHSDGSCGWWLDFFRRSPDFAHHFGGFLKYRCIYIYTYIYMEVSDSSWGYLQWSIFQKMGENPWNFAHPLLSLGDNPPCKRPYLDALCLSLRFVITIGTPGFGQMSGNFIQWDSYLQQLQNSMAMQQEPKKKWRYQSHIFKAFFSGLNFRGYVKRWL